MIYMCENMNTYQMSSIMEEDVEGIREWYNKQNILRGRERKVMSGEEFQDCFLGYALSDEEFFVKITMHGKIAGMIKGHITCNQENELWITHVVFDKEYEGDHGKEWLRWFIENMKARFEIKICFAGVFENTDEVKAVFGRSQFEKFRTVSNYFSVKGEKVDGEILFKIC